MINKNFFKKHWITAVALPASGLVLGATAVIQSELVQTLSSDIPTYPGFGGYYNDWIDTGETPRKITMIESEPYSRPYLEAFYSNVINPRTTEQILLGAFHPIAGVFENHVVAHFNADDYNEQTGEWPESQERTSPLQNNGVGIYSDITSATKTTIRGNTFISCNGEYDSFTGTIPAIGHEEGAAIILVAKAGSGEDSYGTYNNIAFSLDSSQESADKSKFKLIDNKTSNLDSPYRGYIGYMNGDGSSSTTRILTDGLASNGVEVHVMYVGSGKNALSAYYVNGKPVHIDTKTKTDLIPAESDQLSICGALDDYGVASDLKIAEMIILKDDGETPLPYTLLTQTALSMSPKYGISRALTSSYTYYENHPETTQEDLDTCGSDPFEGAITCSAKDTYIDDGNEKLKFEFGSPVVGGRIWISSNEDNAHQLPANRDLSKSSANKYLGHLHSINFLGDAILALDTFSPYNTEETKWFTQIRGSSAKIPNLEPTYASDDLTTINHIDGSSALHCDGNSALSSYVAGGLELTDGMTIVVSGQLNNVDPEKTGPRGLFNIGEFEGTSAGNRALVELRHTQDGYLWESSLGGSTEKVFVGNMPFHVAIQLKESLTGTWTRHLTVVTENGWDKRFDLRTKLDRVKNSDTVYVCGDGRGQHGEADISSIYILEGLDSFPFINEKQTLHKLIEVANSNHPLHGNPIHEPNLNEHKDLISFFKTLRL